MESFDVIVVGAGISGIGAACHLQRESPQQSFIVLEARDNIGGTWDLFRYPGIRSDSDMYTMGYSFKPWKHPRSIADGSSILSYLEETIEEEGLQDKIRLNHRIQAAQWDSDQGHWTVDVQIDGNQATRFNCRFLFMCTGYYRYDAGYTPTFEGSEDFRGQLIHPQHWPQDLDYRNKRVVVIGSGATAVTIVPVIAETAAQVTMLQRSPTYMLTRPGEDSQAELLYRWLPDRIAYWLIRWRNILLTAYLFHFCRSRPERARRLLLRHIQQQIPDIDAEIHFNPNYGPWEQRLCLVRDGDLFEAINAGTVTIETDTIDHFTTDGIRLTSGKELPADIIVTATGLELCLLDDIPVSVDGNLIDPGKTLSYRGVMLSGVPNLAMSFGYTNASWTLKSDLTGRFVCALINHMDRAGYRSCWPCADDSESPQAAFIDFSSGYVKRGIHRFPAQGMAPPWRVYQSYLKDRKYLGPVAMNDSSLQFRK